MKHVKQSTRIVISSLIGTAAYFLIGWLVFELLLGVYMQNNTTNVVGFKKVPAESSIFMLILSCFSYAVLLSVIFGVWGNITNFKSGFIAGSVIGILIAVMTDSYWYSTSHFFNSYSPLLVDVIAASFTVGVTGGVIAKTLGYSR